ncbi:MAG: cold-shock protein [bacterium]
MEQGRVKWFDDQKGYGFVEQDVGDDLFVHYSDIQQEGYKTLSEDQVVEFEIEETEKGLAAKNVSIVSEAEDTGSESEEAEVEDDGGFGEEEFGGSEEAEEEAGGFSIEDDL